VIRRHDERDVFDAGIADRAQHVVEERTPVNGHQRFVPRVGGAPLGVVEDGGRILHAHTRAEATREDDRPTGVSHVTVYMWKIGTGAAVFQAPRVKSGNYATADFFATDWTLSPTTALMAASS